MIRLILFVLTFLLSMTTLTEGHVVQGFDKDVHFVIDVFSVMDHFPKRVRYTERYFDFYDVDTRGLRELHMIGSGAFTKRQISSAIEVVSDPLVIVVLRRESHGFIDGIPVSWYGFCNWENLNKTISEVNACEKSLLDGFEEGKLTPVSKIIRKSIEGAVAEVETYWIRVKNVQTEEELARDLGVGYRRFYISDHLPPKADQVDAFMDFMKTLPLDHWLYFHCRGGRGRTTTFMVLYDIFRNARDVSLSQIIKRQYLIGGKDLSKIGPKDYYKYNLVKARLKFIENFYEYVVTNNDGFTTTWSQWLEEDPSRDVWRKIGPYVNCRCIDY